MSRIIHIVWTVALTICWKLASGQHLYFSVQKTGEVKVIDLQPKDNVSVRGEVATLRTGLRYPMGLSVIGNDPYSSWHSYHLVVGGRDFIEVNRYADAGLPHEYGDPTNKMMVEPQGQFEQNRLISTEQVYLPFNSTPFSEYGTRYVRSISFANNPGTVFLGVWWSEGRSGIYEVDLDAEAVSVEDLRATSPCPDAVTFRNYGTNNSIVFWVDECEGTVNVMNMSDIKGPRPITILDNLVQPKSLVINKDSTALFLVADKKIYKVPNFNVTRVFLYPGFRVTKVALMGSCCNNQRQPGIHPHVFDPFSLAIDSCGEEEMLFWSDPCFGAIMRSDLNGGHPVVIYDEVSGSVELDVLCPPILQNSSTTTAQTTTNTSSTTSTVSLTTQTSTTNTSTTSTTGICSDETICGGVGCPGMDPCGWKISCSLWFCSACPCCHGGYVGNSYQPYLSGNWIFQKEVLNRDGTVAQPLIVKTCSTTTTTTTVSTTITNTTRNPNWYGYQNTTTSTNTTTVTSTTTRPTVTTVNTTTSTNATTTTSTNTSTTTTTATDVYNTTVTTTNTTTTSTSTSTTVTPNGTNFTTTGSSSTSTTSYSCMLEECELVAYSFEGWWFDACKWWKCYGCPCCLTGGVCANTTFTTTSTNTTIPRNTSTTTTPDTTLTVTTLNTSAPTTNTSTTRTTTTSTSDLRTYTTINTTNQTTKTKTSTIPPPINTTTSSNTTSQSTTTTIRTFTTTNTTTTTMTTVTFTPTNTTLSTTTNSTSTTNTTNGTTGSTTSVTRSTTTTVQMCSCFLELDRLTDWNIVLNREMLVDASAGTLPVEMCPFDTSTSTTSTTTSTTTRWRTASGCLFPEYDKESGVELVWAGNSEPPDPNLFTLICPVGTGAPVTNIITCSAGVLSSHPKCVDYSPCTQMGFAIKLAKGGDFVQGTTCPADSLANGATCKATCKGNVEPIGRIMCKAGALAGFSYCAHPDNITSRETITLVQGQLEFQADASPTQEQAERAMCRAFNFYDCEYVLSALLSENLQKRRLSLTMTEGRRLQATHTIDYGIKVPPWSSIQSVSEKAKEFMNPNSAAVKAFKAAMLAERIKVTSVIQKYPPVVLLNVLNLVLKSDGLSTTLAPGAGPGAAGEEDSIIEQWWFWLIVILIPILLGVLFYYILKRYNEKAMKKNTKCINASCGRVFKAENLYSDSITGQTTALCPYCQTECPVEEDKSVIGQQIEVLWPANPEQIDDKLAIVDAPRQAAIADGAADDGFYQEGDSPGDSPPRRLALPSTDDGDIIPDEADGPGRGVSGLPNNPGRGGAASGASPFEMDDEAAQTGEQDGEELGEGPADAAERNACLEAILGDIENMMDNPKLGNGHGTNGTNGHPAIADGRAEDFV